MTTRIALLTVALVVLLAIALRLATAWSWLLAYLLAINVVAAAGVAVDKTLARARRWRIPEVVLLGTALAGGSPAAWFAMMIVRHKVSKASYRWRFAVVVAIQALLLAWLVWHAITR